jgi:hypothetical protein
MANVDARAVFIFAFHADCALLDCISCISVLSLYGTPSLVLALSRALGLARKRGPSVAHRAEVCVALLRFAM